MTAVVVSAAVVILGLVGAACFRWWLEFAAAQASAERTARLEVARAAPQDVAALRAEVADLKKQLLSQSFR